MPAPVRAALENLMLTAKEHGITVAGFAFSSAPMCLTNFGTCNDASELRLYERLCSLCEAKREDGMVHTDTIGRKQ